MNTKHASAKVSVILLASYALATPTFAGKACTSNSTESLHLRVNSASAAPDDDGYCFQTPQEMNIKLYELGLCTSASSPVNKASCRPLFYSQTGKDVNLSVGSVNDLIDEASIVEGQYTHGYIVISNRTSIKTVIEFDDVREDDGGGRGVFCFTDGRSVNDTPEPDSIMSCGGDAADAQPSEEVIGFLDDNDDYSNSELQYTIVMQGQTIVSDLYMISSDGTLSTSFEDDFAIYGSQRLQAPITITSNLATEPTLDLGFSITDGVMIGFGGTRPDDAVFEGLKFNVSLN